MTDLPAPFIERTRRLLGDDYPRFAESLESESPTSIRLNPSKSTPTGTIGDPVLWARHGFYLSSRPTFTFDPRLHAGAYYVQEAASMFLNRVIRQYVHEPVRYLDLCAAPGGKTFTIAERMNNKGRVLAFDLHKNRAGLIESGAKRLGLDCIRAGVNNAKVYDEKMPKADKVLCDAPCSGLGVIRRKPEIKYKEPSDFDRLPEIQYDILKTSAEYVKVGGTLVYSTCTLSRAENDEVADRFLAEHPDFEPAPLGEAFGSDSGLCRMSITPAKYNSDGFFIAKFIRLR